MENNFENEKKLIKEKINDIDKLDDTVIAEIINKIHLIKDKNIRNELYVLLINKIKEYIKNNLNTLSSDEIKYIIFSARSKLKNFSKFDEQILIDNKFDEENIFNELNISQHKTTTNDNTSEEKTSKDSSIISDDDTKNTSNIDNIDEENVTIKNTTEDLTSKEREIIKIEEMIKFLRNKNTDYSEQNLEDNSKYNELSIKELKKKLQELEEKRQDLIYYSVHMENGGEDNSLEEINNEIFVLTNLINKKEKSEKYKDFSNEELINAIERYNAKKNTDQIKIQNLSDKLNDLINKREILWNQESQVENGEIEDDSLHILNNEISELQKEIEEIKNSKFFITKKQKVNIDKERQKELMDQIVYFKEYKQILQSRLNRAITNDFNQNEIEQIKIEISKNDEKIANLEKELNNLLFNNEEIRKVEIDDIDEIKEILDQRTAKKYETYTSEELISKKNEINEKILDLVHYGVHIENGQENNNNEHDIIIDLQHELKEIENELNRRNNFNNLTKDEKKLLDNLIEVKNAYDKITEDTVKHFENLDENEKDVKNVIRYVTNHDLFNVLSKYDNHKKLEKELVEDILDKLNIKKELDNKQKNKKLWLKALAAVAGFATGLGFSCIPGVGTITMTIGVTKLAVTAADKTINFFAKRNPEGKCAKIKKFSETQINKITGKVEQKYPGITQKVNKMRAKLKQSPLKCFINGMAVGYVAGNLIEMFTGETLFEHAQDLFNNNSNSIPQVTPGGMNTETIIESNTPNLLNPPVTNLDPSGISGIDLSSIPQGFSSSYSNEPINLFTELAKELSFDKANIVNGEEFWHFIQPDGSGYAWFKADDVRHLVEAASKTVGKTM